VPALAILWLVGTFYSLWLLYTGLSQLMEVPEDKSIAYTTVVLLVAIVIMLVSAVVAALAIPSTSRGF
jgi:hypothetical protein